MNFSICVICRIESCILLKILMSASLIVLCDISSSIMQTIRVSPLRIVSLFCCIVLLMGVLLIRGLNWLM